MMNMFKIRPILAGLALLCAIAFSAALPVSAKADDLGISTTKALELSSQKDNVLFVDVRDPVEILFVGFTDAVDINIPYLIVDRTQWDAEKGRFRLYRNPDFAAQIEGALKARGMDKNATVITMCRSGSERGKPSAAFLQENGFANAHYVVHGFQGSAIKEGPQKGLRLLNGWQNDGLPWQSKPNPDKIYRLDRP
ncbi:rhodanese-like domain-containing protein [Thalassospira profundimaris]